jgi:hypothetical protein
MGRMAVGDKNIIKLLDYTICRTLLYHSKYEANLLNQPREWKRLIKTPLPSNLDGGESAITTGQRVLQNFFGENMQK